MLYLPTVKLIIPLKGVRVAVSDCPLLRMPSLLQGVVCVVFFLNNGSLHTISDFPNVNPYIAISWKSETGVHSFVPINLSSALRVNESTVHNFKEKKR